MGCLREQTIWLRRSAENDQSASLNSLRRTEARSCPKFVNQREPNLSAPLALGMPTGVDFSANTSGSASVGAALPGNRQFPYCRFERSRWRDGRFARYAPHVMPQGRAFNCDFRFPLIFLSQAKSIGCKRKKIQFP